MARKGSLTACFCSLPHASVQCVMQAGNGAFCFNKFLNFSRLAVEIEQPLSLPAVPFIALILLLLRICECLHCPSWAPTRLT